MPVTNIIPPEPGGKKSKVRTNASFAHAIALYNLQFVTPTGEWCYPPPKEDEREARRRRWEEQEAERRAMWHRLYGDPPTKGVAYAS
jgi:hypothetical protein